MKTLMAKRKEFVPRNIKICYLSGGASVPSVRFRLPFFELLSSRGHHVTIMHARPSRYESYNLVGWRGSQRLRRLGRAFDLWRVKRLAFDTVVLETGFVHTEDFSLERHLRSICRRLVYEIDDAVFLLFPEKVAYIASVADHVIVGNEEIGKWIRRYCDSVSVIPTCVDARAYKPRSYAMQKKSRPVVGWIGSAGNIKLMNVCLDALRNVARDLDFQLRIISSVKDLTRVINCDGLDVKSVDIDSVDIGEALQAIDVGLVPLAASEEWMRYKCNAKLIQFFAVAVPVVASNLGFNTKVVRHGQNSVLANSEGEWETELSGLLRDAGRREALGFAARQDAMRTFTVQARLEEYEAAILGDAGLEKSALLIDR
jgi:glycosyltransferase involved in cell wall biosynthesis